MSYSETFWVSFLWEIHNFLVLLSDKSACETSSLQTRNTHSISQNFLHQLKHLSAGALERQKKKDLNVFFCKIDFSRTLPQQFSFSWSECELEKCWINFSHSLPPTNIQYSSFVILTWWSGKFFRFFLSISCPGKASREDKSSRFSAFA